MRMRHSSGRGFIRAMLLLILFYLIIPASWISELFKRAPAEEPKQFEPSSDKFVPNIVHFIRFGKVSLTFIDAVCILAALKNQQPDKLYIHTDQIEYDEVWGKYWKVVTNHSSASVIEVKFLRMPTSIFGKGFLPEYARYHASDVARLRVLIKYGGIYLDNDSYIVKSLEGFFDFEMTLGWEHGGSISDQVLIAKRNARFLHIWLESYRDYRRDEWFYNGGELPTEILRKHPGLVFPVRYNLAEYKTTPSLIYYRDDGRWKMHYAIHLLINHQYILLANISSKATYPVEFNEVNILDYPVNIRQMAMDVYPFDKKIKDRYQAIYPHITHAEQFRRDKLKKVWVTRSPGKLMRTQKKLVSGH